MIVGGCVVVGRCGMLFVVIFVKLKFRCGFIVFVCCLLVCSSSCVRFCRLLSVVCCMLVVGCVSCVRSRVRLFVDCQFLFVVLCCLLYGVLLLFGVHGLLWYVVVCWVILLVVVRCL